MPNPGDAGGTLVYHRGDQSRGREGKAWVSQGHPGRLRSLVPGTLSSRPAPCPPGTSVLQVGPAGVPEGQNHRAGRMVPSYQPPHRPPPPSPTRPQSPLPAAGTDRGAGPHRRTQRIRPGPERGRRIPRHSRVPRQSPGGRAGRGPRLTATHSPPPHAAATTGSKHENKRLSHPPPAPLPAPLPAEIRPPQPPHPHRGLRRCTPSWRPGTPRQGRDPGRGSTCSAAPGGT